MPRGPANADVRRVVGDNLKAVREDRKLPQGTVATLARLQQGMLSRWEKGRALPELDGLLRLAAVYKCSLDDFLGGVDEAYDAIIERRIPVDAKRHYQARLDTFIRRTTAAMALALEPGAPAPTPATPVVARRRAHGKSAPARARRKRQK